MDNRLINIKIEHKDACPGIRFDYLPYSMYLCIEITANVIRYGLALESHKFLFVEQYDEKPVRNCGNFLTE